MLLIRSLPRFCRASTGFARFPMGSITLINNVPQVPFLGSLKLNWRFSVLLASLWSPNVSNGGAQHLVAHMSFSLFHN